MSGVASERLRICLVGPSLEILGGQSVQLQRLQATLRELPGLEVGFVAVNPRLPGPLAALQRVRFVRTVATTIGYLLHLLRRLPGYDVAHCYSASYWSFLLAPVPAMAIARLFGIRVLLNYHSGEAADHLRRSPRLVPGLMRLAHRIVVPSRFLADVFASAGLQAEVIANSIEPGAIRWRERTAPGPRLLSNRNLERIYGVHDVLNAFATVQRHCPEASLTVAGDGSERARLEARAATLGLRHVTFTGRVDPGRMPTLYDAADIYVNASSVDNLPLSLIEASLAGLPIVSTDVGAIPEILDHERSALLAPPGNPEALAAAIQRLLREPELARSLARAARADAMTRYDAAVLGRTWVRCYAGLCGREVPA